MRRVNATVRSLAILSVLTLMMALTVVGSAGAQGNQQDPDEFDFQGEKRALPDIDRRGAPRAPSTRQEALAADLGAQVRWNEFGTPQSLLNHDGYLSDRLDGDAADVARAWLRDNAALFRLSRTAVDSLALVRSTPLGDGTAVLLEQRVDDLPVAGGGQVSLAVDDGRVAYVSSSIVGNVGRSGSAKLSARQAVQTALRDVGRRGAADAVTPAGRARGWQRFEVDTFTNPASARRVALALTRGGVVPAYQTFILDNDDEPLAFTHVIDARTGQVVLRSDEVDYAGEPKWAQFPAYPSLDYSSTDTRETWCWASGPGCERVLAQDPDTTPLAWDVDPTTGTSTTTTIGNNALSVENWDTGNPFTVGTETADPRPGRDYQYPWTNQWYEEGCSPEVFTSDAENDIDAATSNLFAGHNQMHDWSYRLGFTEATWNAQVSNFGKGEDGADPEQGNAQAGARVGVRDNANQITPPDGQAPITNMYVWQAIAGAFYAPCVDGDFDMTVIGHEYTHMISNRMVAGPDTGLQGLHGRAMGESWSDLVAMEILNEYGWVPVADESPYTIGAYVTSDPVAGIRNFNMSDSPLNFSDVGYDLTGPQVHADGEIWSATNFDIRRDMIARYGAGSAAEQRACADGETPVEQCPGNRRWAQLMFDAWLLMPAATTMLDARDAMLAADAVRFGGANADLLWNAFAQRGMGDTATATSGNDDDPVPSFASPFADEATVTFKAIGEDGEGIPAELYVGRYEARATPVADTDPDTELGATFDLIAGTHEFTVRADGYGTTRATMQVKPGQVRDLPVQVRVNRASAHNGATASGDGLNVDKLIDDTEATNWAALGEPVAGQQVTVQLDPSRPTHTIRRVQVSAMLRPGDQNDPGGDTGGQSRFSALRQFELWACTNGPGVDCAAEDAPFTKVFTSADDAFPAVAPRPRAPELITRSFAIPQTWASAVRLVVVTNQCTGTPDYQGEQDNDPNSSTDCSTASSQALNVRAAELQVFAR
jgi:extracellular elastinolytic metalloproteinase